MQYLFDVWDVLSLRLRRKNLFLFLDYDGTLVPIAASPEKAVLADETRQALSRLAGLPGIRLAIISGRSIKDIKKMVGISGIIYVGNHGLEIEGPKIRFLSPLSGRYRSMLEGIRDKVRAGLSAVKGTFVEDKGLILAVHYRLADERKAPLVKTIVHEAVITYLVKNRLKIRPGKKVMEIIPPVEWNKGKVALWLLGREKFRLDDKEVVPLFVGDDTTDEDAFRALAGRGVTIFVGEPKTASAARYYLNSSREVRKLLGCVAELRQEPGKECRN